MSGRSRRAFRFIAALLDISGGMCHLGCMLTYRNSLLLLVLSVSTSLLSAGVPRDLLGYWTLDLSTGEPAWLQVEEKDGEPVVFMRMHVGGAGPHKGAVMQDGQLEFPLKIKRQLGEQPVTSDSIVTAGVKKGRLTGTIVSESVPAPFDKVNFTGRKIPPVGKAPDLSKVRFGQPVRLFNGSDLNGWRLSDPAKTNGWSVRDGLLVNDTPKTDFSNTGTYGNLVTEAEFEDFWLHIEFKPEAGQNSGVYLRGMYEAQVVDRDSRMQGLAGIGSIFSLIAPSHQAAGEPGTWQTYDLTLVDRHVTVVLNGETVIDNQPVHIPTGGAIRTDPTAPGPIFLQGDHTSITYRDIYLAPVMRD